MFMLELRPLDGNIARNSIIQFNNNSTQPQQEPLIVLLIHWKILGRNSRYISYCKKTMMWFDTSAVASAPSLTFFISVVSDTFGSSGPSVNVALAVSWNKTSQLKLYTKGPTICLWKEREGIFCQTSGDSFFLTYMGVRFFSSRRHKRFFFSSV